MHVWWTQEPTETLKSPAARTNRSTRTKAARELESTNQPSTAAPSRPLAKARASARGESSLSTQPSQVSDRPSEKQESSGSSGGVRDSEGSAGVSRSAKEDPSVPAALTREQQHLKFLAEKTRVLGLQQDYLYTKQEVKKATDACAAFKQKHAPAASAAGPTGAACFAKVLKDPGLSADWYRLENKREKAQKSLDSYSPQYVKNLETFIKRMEEKEQQLGFHEGRDVALSPGDEDSDYSFYKLYVEIIDIDGIDPKSLQYKPDDGFADCGGDGPADLSSTTAPALDP